MKIHLIFGALSLALSSPAVAEVKASGDNGFSVVHIAEVDAKPEVIWARLISPKDYWSKAHSWSGRSDGFSLDPKIGGCFCEAIREEQPDGKLKTIGNVEHMRVIFSQPGKVLRLQGALGPLQSEAMLGTLTVAIEPVEDNEKIKLSFSYVVGGYMRYKTSEIAPAVDKVIGEQFKNLIEPFVPVEKKASEWNLDIQELKLGDVAEAVEVKKAPAEKPKDKPLPDPEKSR